MNYLIKKGIAGLALCFATYCGNAQEKPALQKNIGEPAPALSIGKWLKGGEINGFEKGKIYVVEFWATWCLPCIAGMPHLSAIAHQYKDVTVIGCSILERKTTTLPMIEKFVAGKRDTMDYHVAVENGSQMADNWLHAYGERGIPEAFIVDKEGCIAWVGHPMNLDRVLPQIISGNWDIKAATNARRDFKRLTVIDQNAVVKTLNPYMGNPGRPVQALAVIDSIVKENPGLKYLSNTGHFTFWSLVKSDPQKALVFGKAWLAANDEPRYATVTEAVTNRPGLPGGLYVFAAEAYQAQLDRYPWSMNFPDTYKKMAGLYHLAGDTKKEAEMLKRSQDPPPSGTRK